MPDFRDDLDDWLNVQIRPLSPPPGTFELVRKRARRRKARRAAMSVAAAAAVVAVAAAVPRVLLNQVSTGRQTSSAYVGRTHPPGRTTTPGSLSPSSLATGHTHVTIPPTLPPVPTPFSPSSVTFVGTSTGWVIGQAGIPGHCATRYCTSIARTDNLGKTWYGVKAPITGPPDGSRGVGQIRFLGVQDGWAFGPELWETHDGGRNWTKIDTGGRRVTALEARGQRVFAVWAHCSGGGSDFATGCRDFALYSSPSTVNAWAPVPGAGSGLNLTGTASSASLVLTGPTGYLLAPDGVLFSGPTSGAGTWEPVTGTSHPQPVPCVPGPAQPDGQPSQAMLVSTGSYLALLCAATPSGTTQTKTLYYSSDGGKSWQPGAPAPATGVAQSLSGSPSPSGPLVLATDQGIEIAATVTSPWQTAGGRMPAGGFSYVGMTFPNQGVAVPADLSQHAVWLTYDGGITWHKSPVR